MSSDEWPYDEHGFPRRAGLDIDWFLRGAGLDSDDNVFNEDDLRAYLDVDFIEYDDHGRVVIPTKTLECGCNPRAMVAGAHELLKHLTVRTLGFPRTDSQVEMLRQFHEENVPWRKWIDTRRSIPSDGNRDGSICMWGCGLPGHHCYVVIDNESRCSITGVDLSTFGDASVLGLPDHAPPADQNTETAEDVAGELEEAFERKEKSYDERTFGDLEPHELTNPGDGIHEPEEAWRDSGFTAQDVQIFISHGITPLHASEMLECMALQDVAKWVRRFKEDWRQALEIYRLALGKGDEEVVRDAAVEALAESIRMSVHSTLRKSRRSAR